MMLIAISTRDKCKILFHICICEPLKVKIISPFPYIDTHCCHYITNLDFLTLSSYNKLDSGTCHLLLYITPSLYIECHCGRIWSIGEGQQQTYFLQQRTTLYIHWSRIQRTSVQIVAGNNSLRVLPSEILSLEKEKSSRLFYSL